MRFSAAELVAALTARNLHGDRARLVGPDVEIDGVTFDSRDVRPGQLFVPIVAERDGHDFIGDALAAGAVAYLSSRDDAHARFGGTAIRVRDTAESLIDVGGWVRTLFPASTVVIGVTGSVGKTSTKDFIAVALGGQIATTANIRSFNNEQGLPVTIINAPSDTRALVLEMGMRGFGQIADLCRIARPSIGVVTRVGEAHTELVGGLDGVAQAKGELIEALPPQGFAILNADDERVRAMASRSSAPVLLYGESGDADVRIDGLAVNEHGRATFDVIVRGELSGCPGATWRRMPPRRSRWVTPWGCRCRAWRPILQPPSCPIDECRSGAPRTGRW
jgi:UDP-N-acetylmuramoyl-tripeptide--D-alanyl-D-alanine ligase